MLTRITDRMIPCVYIHVYRITKKLGPGPYNSLRHANRRYFSKLKGSARFTWRGKWENCGYVLAEKKVTL